MTIRYDTDVCWQALASGVTNTADGRPQAWPRKTVYGSLAALSFGLNPIEDYPDKLVDPNDYKEVIKHCVDQKIFTQFHQYDTWAPQGTYHWNQNGLPYCWAWSMAAAILDCRATEKKDTIQLAPVSLGGAVNWRSQGYYLDGTIAHAKAHGIAPAIYVPDQHSRNPRTFKDGWEDAALDFRPGEVWDTNNREGKEKMIQHCLSTLSYGRPLYGAWDWWGHAVEICAILWDETEWSNLVWILRNSHNEDDVIELTGSRAVPSEAYGIISTEMAMAA